MHNNILAMDTFYKKQATLLPITPSCEHGNQNAHNQEY